MRDGCTHSELVFQWNGAGDGNRTRVLSLGNRFWQFCDLRRFEKGQLSGAIWFHQCCPVMPISDPLWHGYGTTGGRESQSRARRNEAAHPTGRDDPQRCLDVAICGNDHQLVHR